MPANNDIIELTLYSQMAQVSVNALNVFHFQVSTPEPIVSPLVLGELIGDWFDSITDLLKPVTGTGLSWTRVYMRNMTNPLEFYDYNPPSPTAGSVAVEYNTPFIAWAFRLNRTTTLTRNGQKRFAGVPETLVENGVIIPGAVASMDDIAAFIGEPQQFEIDETADPPFDVTLVPVIVRKTSGGVLDVFQYVASATYVSVSSQTTRKIGRGM